MDKNLQKYYLIMILICIYNYCCKKYNFGDYNVEKIYKDPAQVYDLIGIGLGPFNLGLAALADDVSGLNTLFIEQASEFNWHPGLMLDNATLQVPFLADLVSLADPTSQYSFFNYLHNQNRLYKFYFYENFFILRKEYNHYCQWVASQLQNIRFATKVVNISISNEEDDGKIYHLEIHSLETNTSEILKTRHIALGIGTKPYIPSSLVTSSNLPVYHSADFISYASEISDKNNICVVGSGQSAGEVVLELLNRNSAKENKQKIYWITRSNGFFPMEYSKLGLEHFSPDYMGYFYTLPENTRRELIGCQDMMYKGISKQTIADIFDSLYRLTIANNPQPLTMLANTSLDSVSNTSNDQQLTLNVHNCLSQTKFQLEVDALILATGYRTADLSIMSPLDGLLEKDSKQNYALNADFSLKINKSDIGKIFMQNNSLYSHGVGSPDLGLGAYRNSVIINTICNRTVYKTAKKNVFQSFGAINEFSS